MFILNSSLCLRISATLLAVVLVQNVSCAQVGADQTLMTVEIMLPKIAGDLAMAQKWGKVFEQLGQGVRIRQPLPSDEPEIKERQRGTLRFITIVGELNRDGQLVFPDDKVFDIADQEEIKAWLDEIKVYGAQGSPEGKKFWGLNEQQFESVVKAVSKPIVESTQGQPLEQVLKTLPVGDGFLIVIHPQIHDDFAKIQSQPVTQEFRGTTVGTALAIMLKEFGFGFSPLRTPRQTIELTITSLASTSDPWPIGWDIDDTQPRNEVVPQLFEFVKTGFEEASLKRVLDAISEQTGTPIFIDVALCREKEIDITTTLVSYPSKQTAWSLVLNSVVGQARLTQKIRLDEANRPFVWVAPFVPYIPDKK